MDQLPNMIYLASIWVIPLVTAITFHEAAHGFVAHFLGDETAWRLGRVSLNPLKHIHPPRLVDSIRCPSSIEGYQHTAIPTRAEDTVADSPVSVSARSEETARMSEEGQPR